MRFAEPYWLLVGAAAVTLLFVLLARAERLRARALDLLLGARLLSASTAVPSRARRWLRVGMATAAVAMGFGALARPQKGTHWETVTRNGLDLLLVVDTSRSMDADDVKPTRLARAKLAIRDLVEKFPGDRIGLVAFAGDAFLASPMTLDHGALLDTLDAFDTSVVARGGTNIGRAIDVAASTLAESPTRQKVAVLLTDGEDLEGHGLDEAKRAGEAGIVIDTVGIGTGAGEIVPARDAKGAIVGVVRGEDGAPVRSRLDETGLRAIAEATHGAYRPLGQDGRGLDRLYSESLAGLTHVDASSRTRRVYDEWFEIPLGLALAALVLEALLGWRGLRSTKRSRDVGSAAAAVAVAALLFGAAPPARASVETATRAYAAGRFDEAAKDYEAERAKKPKDARLAFNAGDAAYRSGHFDAADAAFEHAMTEADPTLQERVLYNQGNTKYRLGEAQKAGAREQTIEQWKAAIKAYEGAIALDPKDADAAFNRDFVKRKLAELEQKQDQKPPPPKDQDKKEKNGGGKDQDKGDKGDKGDKSGKGQDKSDKGDKSGKGDKGQDKSDKGDKSGKDQDKGDSKSASPSGPGGNPEHAKDNPGETGDASHAEPGRLSAEEARALLRSLRGEEHHGVSHGSGTDKPSDDVPGKDW